MLILGVRNFGSWVKIMEFLGGVWICELNDAAQALLAPVHAWLREERDLVSNGAFNSHGQHNNNKHGNHDIGDNQGNFDVSMNAGAATFTGLLESNSIIPRGTHQQVNEEIIIVRQPTNNQPGVNHMSGSQVETNVARGNFVGVHNTLRSIRGPPQLLGISSSDSTNIDDAEAENVNAVRLLRMLVRRFVLLQIKMMFIFYRNVLAIRTAGSNECFKLELSQFGSLVSSSFAKGPNPGS